MAWTTPGTATAGEVLTAAFWNTNVRDNSIMGSPVYTNEAARDAAIPAPSEGMQCYLTSPTVPAATGATTAVPTGVRTIYNGSVWVCVTEVGANSNTSGTTTSLSYVTTLTGDGTAISVTTVTGTTAEMTFGFNGFVSGGSGAVSSTVSVSGATTIAAADTNMVRTEGNSVQNSVGTSFVVTGLTAGTNTFTLNYRTTAFTSNYLRRWLMIKGIA
jgi:hypothetical protein